jgi:hypothetical protein
MARHWSDVALMSTAERFQDEKLSFGLLAQVINFNKIYFAANWAHYDIAIPATLRIVPNEALQAILRKDYRQMQEMFPSKPLSFDEILTGLGMILRTLKRQPLRRVNKDSLRQPHMAISSAYTLAASHGSHQRRHHEFKGRKINDFRSGGEAGILTLSLWASYHVFSNLHENRMNIGDFYLLSFFNSFNCSA